MKKTIRNVDVENKRVLVRVDFNVPLEDGGIADESRIRASLQTIRYLVERRARVIILSHLDRPNGFVVEEFRTDRIAERLSELLEMPVMKVNNCIGPEVHEAVQSLLPGQVLFLENVRFHPGEMVNDSRFAARLASFADIFVNDAFATSHRIQASTVGVANNIPAVAGLLMDRELQELRRIQSIIQPPVVLLLGGTHMVDKARFLGNHLSRENKALLGGTLANTFLQAKGINVGQSTVDVEVLALARAMLAESGALIELPVDVVVADDYSAQARSRVVSINRIPEVSCIVDIGPATAERYNEIIEKAGTLIWNGPLGASEYPPFLKGTEMIARKIAGLQNTVKVAGGGDTIAALERMGLTGAFDYLSTGGTTLLYAIENRPLPAIAVLQDEEQQSPQETEPLPQVEGQTRRGSYE